MLDLKAATSDPLGVELEEVVFARRVEFEHQHLGEALECVLVERKRVIHRIRFRYIKEASKDNPERVVNRDLTNKRVTITLKASDNPAHRAVRDSRMSAIAGSNVA